MYDNKCWALALHEVTHKTSSNVTLKVLKTKGFASINRNTFSNRWDLGHSIYLSTRGAFRSLCGNL